MYTVETSYNAVLGIHVSHPRYNLTVIFRNGVKDTVPNDDNTYPLFEIWLSLSFIEHYFIKVLS